MLLLKYLTFFKFDHVIKHLIKEARPDLAEDQKEQLERFMKNQIRFIIDKMCANCGVETEPNDGFGLG